MNKLLILCVLAAVAAFPQAQTPLTITQSAGTATGELRMQERRTNGTNYVGIKAPQSVAANTVWTLPDADGTAAQCLQTDGAGALSFAACAGYWTLSGSDIYRSTGLVTIGHTAATVRLGQNLNTNKSSDYGGMALNTFSATGSHGSVLDFNKSASGTLGAHGAVASGDTLGFFVFRGSDGAAFQRASEVLGEVDGTVSSGVVPGRIRFRTANASGTMTESWRIDKDGAFRPGADDTFSIGLTGTRVLGVYAKFGEFYKSGSTASSDYLTTRKYNILDQSGGSGAWDIQASGSTTSSIKIRDNSGSRWLEAYRALSGSPLNYTSVFGNMYPAKRVIADGDAVDDTVFGDLGATSARWANIYGATANFTAMTIPTGSTTGYVWTDTGSGVGAWQAGGLDAYDVRNFGAVCDGTTDDTAAIESAISAGAANKHKAILPQGTCKITTINIVNQYAGIRGQGRNNSILYSTTDAPMILVDNTGTLYNLEFSDFMLKGSDAGTSQTGIESGTDGFGVSTIRNLYFENLWRGVKFAHSANIGANNVIDNAFSMGGTAYSAASLSNGTVYVIGSVGTTDFTLIGAASNTVGVSFTKSGSAGTGTGIAYLESTFNKVGIESTNTSSGGIWSRNFFGGLAMPFNATRGVRAFYLHAYVGDTVMDGNHMEGGWIGFDISCDNGTFATGICSYGENLVITDSKVDGYAYDYRLYNVSNSTILGSRGRGVLDSQITGTNTKGMIFDVVGRVDSGSAIERAGWKLTTSYGDVAINAYDEGRIRIGDTSSDISFTKNGISILDSSYSSAIALGQSASRNMGMFWTRDATAANAYGVIYTYGYSNPMLYGASAHSFTGGKLSVTNAGPGLGAGQNIADIWATGSAGFVSLGFYRTDDTNGGWLIGTSGVAAGDFAIYQNQGASAPVRRLSIDTSGILDVVGNMSAATINATGSPAYRVSGTTVINASREATFAGLTIATGAASGYVWTSDASGVGSWQESASGLPVTDTTGIAKGSSDATKIVRLEVDGFTTATTRVLTPPNANATIAGLEVQQSFTAPQTVAIASVQNQMTLTQTNPSGTYDPACLVLASSDTVTSTTYGAARLCAGYESASFSDEKFAIQTATGSGTYQDAVTFKNQVATFAGDLTATAGTFSFNNGTMDGTMKPLFSGNGSIGSATYKYGDFFGTRGNFGSATIGAASATVRLGQNLDVNYSEGYAGMAINTWSSTDAHGGVLDFNKSGSGTIGTHAAVVSGETLGFFVFRGSDGSAFQRAVEVNGEVDGTVSSGVVPGRIRIRTTNTSGVMTERMRIDSAGLASFYAGVDVTGNLSAAVINATGSPAYRVSGTTVIDSSRNASFVGLTLNGSITGDLIPATSAVYVIGSSSFLWNNIHADVVTVYTSLIPDASASANLGGSTKRWTKTWTADLDITGTVTPPSGTAFTGTKTVRASGGLSDCTLTFSAGIMTGGTC